MNYEALIEDRDEKVAHRDGKVALYPSPHPSPARGEGGVAPPKVEG
jgi:hypothetical protein